MKNLNIDIETYSGVNLIDSGVHPYTESSDFEILLFAYAADFGPVHVIDLASGEELPGEIRAALSDPSVIKHAFNANFEITCLNAAGFGTDARQWHCTQAHSLYCGYPISLAKSAEALGLPADQQKDRQGKALIRYFSIPCKPTKVNGGRTRNLPAHDPDKWNLYKEYNRQDVVTEMAVMEKLSPWPMPPSERQMWQIDHAINARGVGVDSDLVAGAIAIRDAEEAAMTQEVIEISGVSNPNSVIQMKDWVEGQIGEPLPNLTKDTVAELIKTTQCEDVRRVLELRQGLGKSSLKKLDAFRAAVAADGRIHGTHQYYGASRTGRWSGRIIQPQNLPRESIPATKLARELVKARNTDALRLIWGKDIPTTLSALIRSMIVPKNGSKLIVADFSAIEARVIAWLAGERWRQEVFKTHGKIYEASASQMFGVPIDQITKGSDLRQRGKVAELALGYQGGAGALISMGALDMGIPETDLSDIVHRWRQANPNIVQLWRDYEDAAFETMTEGGPVTTHHVTFSREASGVLDFLLIDLPSGRSLFYAQPEIGEGKFGATLQYLDAGYNGMVRAETYGGKLTENITQAIARDCLSESLHQLAANWEVIMHVHDEVVLDVPPDVLVKTVTTLMGLPIKWAPGLLLKAEGFECEFYMKD